MEFALRGASGQPDKPIVKNRSYRRKVARIAHGTALGELRSRNLAPLHA
jgi:hypothetical protein